MASTPISDRGYAWIWLPGETEPVPAGVLVRAPSGAVEFRYGDQYLARENAISIYTPRMPLGTEWIGPQQDMGIASPLRDAAPDAWGRRVIVNHLVGADADLADLDELTYLLESGSNRIGALDFQPSASEYVPRSESGSLDELQDAADRIQEGETLTPALAAALVNGTAIGGARPKALVHDGDGEWIAKFSTSGDPFDVVGAEAACMHLAAAAGIPVPEFRIVRSLGRKVLLSQRFDRVPGGARRQVISAMTMVGATERETIFGSPRNNYTAILDVLAALGSGRRVVGAQLFLRIAFAIATTINDDHLRNHAAFWDGQRLDLTPAYDLSPGPRSGDTSEQALGYGRDGRRVSNLNSLLEVAHEYGLTRPEADAVVSRVVSAIDESWPHAVEVAELTSVDAAALRNRQILNPAIWY